MDAAEPARKRFDLIGWALDERLRRLLAAAEARVLGRGGVTAVATATGVSRRAIHAGLKELAERPEATLLAASADPARVAKNWWNGMTPCVPTWSAWWSR